MKWGAGLVVFCVCRLSEDGAPVPKDVVVILIMNSLLCLYFIKCICLWIYWIYEYARHK